MKRLVYVVISLAVIVGVALSLYKIEHIQEVCSLTGSSRRYERYFSIFSTKPEIEQSWIERTLRRNGVPVPGHRWVRTMGDTWTVGTFARIHGRAPVTYRVRTWSEAMLLEQFTEEELLALAQDFASGAPERQDRAAAKLDY